ncbi:hypothetical protein [Streptomyces sp. NPDC002845]
MTRTHTPDQVTTDADGRKTTIVTTKRACNGCGELVGDITEAEMTAAIAGRPLPDVRRECPTCAPTAPPPACRPMQVVAGEGYCLLRDCDHDIATDADYCGEVREETVCAIHSQFSPGFEDAYEVVTHAEPWPCKHTEEPTP